MKTCHVESKIFKVKQNLLYHHTLLMITRVLNYPTQKMSKGLGLEVKLFLIVAQGQTILHVMYWLS